MVCHECQVGLQTFGDSCGPERIEPPSSMNIWPYFVTYPHRRTAEGLCNSAKSKCKLCRSLWYSPWANSRDEFTAYFVVTFAHEIRPGESSPMSLRTQWEGRVPAPDFPLYPQNEGPRPRMAARSTGSAQSWVTVQKWMDNCIQNHDKCTVHAGSATPKDRAPKRLLDIGAGSSCLVRLKQRSELPPTCKYVTLSHCWGNRSFVRLSRATESGLVKGISTDDLPLTFQNAVEITRRLKVQYLWIDSLCILQDQDDRSDWLEQSQSMESVYSQAFCNLAAVAASDPSQGLFHGELFESPTVRLPRYIFDKDGDSVRYSIYVGARYQWEVEKAPLTYRAWFHQERWMARRTLYFLHNQLYWLCRAAYASEEWPLGLPKRGHGQERYQKIQSIVDLRLRELEHSTSMPNSLSLQEVNDSWWDVCEEYSRCALTQPGDKLIALAGLAKCFGRVIKGTYVAGMWRRDLVQGLLWYVVPGHQGRRPLEYRAPTFSWASIDGRISRKDGPGKDSESPFKVIDVYLKLQDGPYGPLCKGTLLRLQGRMWRFRLLSLGADTLSPQTLDNTNSGAFFFDATNDDRPNDAFVQGKLYRILVKDFGGEGWPFITFLMVQCSDHKSGRFRRIGMNRVPVRDIQVPEYLRGAGFEPVKGGIPASEYRQPDEDAAQLPCVEYDAKRGLHTIDIE